MRLYLQAPYLGEQKRVVHTLTHRFIQRMSNLASCVVLVVERTIYCYDFSGLCLAGLYPSKVTIWYQA